MFLQEAVQFRVQLGHRKAHTLVEVADQELLQLGARLDHAQRRSERIADRHRRQRVVVALHVGPVEHDSHALIERSEFLVGAVADASGDVGEAHAFIEVAIGDQGELGPRRLDVREVRRLFLVAARLAIEHFFEAFAEALLQARPQGGPLFLRLQVEVARVAVEGLFGQFVQLVHERVERLRDRFGQRLDGARAALAQEAAGLGQIDRLSGLSGREGNHVGGGSTHGRLTPRCRSGPSGASRGQPRGRSDRRVRTGAAAGSGWSPRSGRPGSSPICTWQSRYPGGLRRFRPETLRPHLSMGLPLSAARGDEPAGRPPSSAAFIEATSGFGPARFNCRPRENLREISRSAVALNWCGASARCARLMRK